MISFFLFLFWTQVFAQCEIKILPHEIPSFEEKSESQFYYCLGMLHGRDRAFEMDFFRRSGEGRNAEALGFKHLKTDLQMRLLNLIPLRDRLWSELDQEIKNKLETYSRGVNHGFSLGQKSPEFVLNGIELRPWKPQDSILVLLLQSFDQTRKTFYRDYEEELRRESSRTNVKDLFDESKTPWYQPIIDPKKNKLDEKTVRHEIKTFFKATALETIFGEESGSNNWVVDAQHTQSKNALFANDPHLDLKTPMFWYWIKTDQIFGATLPGVPVVVSGTNNHVAWGLTNSYLNTANAVEITDITSTDLITFYPRVDIKFWFFKIPFFFKSFEKLKTGEPVLPLDLPSKKRMVLEWSGYHLKGRDLEGLFQLKKVQRIIEADNILKTIQLPSWNFVFADQQGKIGYRTIGKVFKSTADLFGVQQKTLRQFYQPEFLKPDENPSLLNPTKGYIATANQPQWSTSYPLKFGGGHSLSFRAKRINQLLSSTKNHDLNSMKLIQCDTYATDAEYLLPLLLKIQSHDPLKKWDLRVHSESKEVGLYRRWIDLILEKENLDEVALYQSLLNPTQEMKKIVTLSFLKAKQDTMGRKWSDILKVNFPHFSLDEKLNFSPLQSGVGDKQTINPGSARWNEDKKIYEQFSGASMRLVIEMSEPIKVFFAMPGRNIHYQKGKNGFNPWESWAKCDYVELKNFDRSYKQLGQPPGQ